MLRYKGWLETKFKILLLIGFMIFYLIVFYSMRTGAAAPGPKSAAMVAVSAVAFAVVTFTWLAGAGIVTQPALQATKGIHGSTLFTLSLPVSRFRMLAVRASLGWLEMAGLIITWCCGMWLVVPVVRGSVTAKEMFEYNVALIACVSSLYFVSVLLATFLDDQWRMVGSAIAFGALWALSTFVPLPASLNIVRAMMGDRSPLIAHTMPWTTMGLSVALAAILFLAALKVVQTREY